jgi:hypothetical protein
MKRINEADECEAEVPADSVEEERRQPRALAIGTSDRRPLAGPQLCSATSAYMEIPCEPGLRTGGEHKREEGGGKSESTRISRTHRG